MINFGMFYLPLSSRSFAMKNNAIVSGPTWLPVQKSYDVLIKSRTFMRFCICYII